MNINVSEWDVDQEICETSIRGREQPYRSRLDLNVVACSGPSIQGYN